MVYAYTGVGSNAKAEFGKDQDRSRWVPFQDLRLGMKVVVRYQISSRTCFSFREYLGEVRRKDDVKKQITLNVIGIKTGITDRMITGSAPKIIMISMTPYGAIIAPGHVEIGYLLPGTYARQPTAIDKLFAAA